MKRVVATAFPTDPYLDSPITLGAATRAARSIGVALQTLVDIEAGKLGVSIGKKSCKSLTV